MKAILTFFLLFIVTADAQFLQHRRKEFYRGIYEVTETFDSLLTGSMLSTASGWKSFLNDFLVSSGAVYGQNPGGFSNLWWEPARFVTPQNHEAEVTLKAAVAGGGGWWQGCSVAVQPATGEGYWLAMDNDGTVYFGRIGLSYTIADYLSVKPTAGIPAGSKLRLTALGTGATRTATASYNIGAGWVTPAGWDKRDFGAAYRFDGGKCGLLSYNNGSNVQVDSITIRNQSERYNSFDQYASGTLLSAIPGWTVYGGDLITGDAAAFLQGRSSTGVIFSHVGVTYCHAGYDFPGFIIAQNHEVEAAIGGYNPGGANYAGVCACLQPNGYGYFMHTGSGDANIYFGIITPGSATDFVYVPITAGTVTSEIKMKLTVTGAGATRAVTGSYNINETGWVTPAGWANKNFGAGKQYDGGKPGIVGYNSEHGNYIADLRVRNIVPPPAGVTYLVNEDFEGTGLPAGWFNSGGDFDNTTGPLAGAQSIRFASGTSSYAVFLGGGPVNHTEAWGKFLWKQTSNPASFNTIFDIRDVDYGQQYGITVLSNGTVVCGHGGAQSAATAALTPGTLYRVYWHWKKNTGSSNGVYDVGITTTDVRPTSGSFYVGGTNGTGPAKNVEQLFIQNGDAAIENRFDNLQISATVFD